MIDLKSGHYAFEPFGTVQGVLAGEPFKIFPQGTWYRGGRKLEITEMRLRNMEKNFSAGLPRFRVPINENHAGIGKVGTILGVKYESGGADGPGLYATKYELTDEGRKLIQQKRYDAVSGEVVWTLNGGSKYQDPESGEYFDDLLVGLALTATPFFGHKSVALYSDKPDSALDEFVALLTEKFDDLKSYIKKEAPRDDDPDDDEDEEDKSGEDHKPEHKKMKETMADTITPEQFAAQAEAIEKLTAALARQQSDYDAKLQAQAEQFKAQQETEKAEREAIKKEAETFATALATEKKSRRLGELSAQAQSFAYLPVSTDEFSENFYALEQKDAKLAEWFTAQFAQFNTAIGAGNLFSQVSRPNAQTGVETLNTFAEKILVEEFKNDPAKKSEALLEAGKRRPDLVPADLRQVRGARRGD